MSTAVDAILVGLVLTSFVVLGSSRFGSCIRVVAFQGVLLGLLTMAAGEGDVSLRTYLLAFVSAGLKGIVFPWLLSRALRDAEVRREVEPLVGYGPSVVVGLVALAGALWIAGRLPPPSVPVSSLVVPVALFTTLAGLFLIVGRRQALMQVLGYLVMENGIYVFGVGLVQGTPMLVELGVLLDVFVGVFVMGIAIFHISREFDHIDTERLRTLKDWAP